MKAERFFHASPSSRSPTLSMLTIDPSIFCLLFVCLFFFFFFFFFFFLFVVVVVVVVVAVVVAVVL